MGWLRDGLAGCEKVISGDPRLAGIRLHRCLQHTKQNLKEAAKKRDPATGETRLKNTELLPLMADWLVQSAWVSSSVEFSCFWESVMARLRASEAPTDWREPLFADYLEKQKTTCTLSV